MTDGADIRGGGRFELAVTPGRRHLIKRGDPAALAREARALRLLEGTGDAPRIIGSRHGELVTELLPGRPRPLGRLSDPELRALGGLLRRVHDVRRSAQGGLHTWPSRARSLSAYARRRIADADPPARFADVAERVRRHLAPFAPAGPQPFRLLHGDLVEHNIVWTPRPVLVDWEFWRMGDPAEDLAYLAVLNDLAQPALDMVLTGYDDASVTARVDAWRPICALDAGAWHLRRGAEDAADALIGLADRLVSGLPRPAR